MRRPRENMQSRLAGFRHENVTIARFAQWIEAAGKEFAAQEAPVAKRGPYNKQAAERIAI